MAARGDRFPRPFLEISRRSIVNSVHFRNCHLFLNQLLSIAAPPMTMTEGLTVPDAEDVEKGVKALASAKDSDKPQSEGPTPQSTRPSTAVPVSETPVSLPSSVDMSNLSADDTFDVVFVNDLPNGLQCGLCEQVLRAPVKLPCAHKFCRGCVESMK